jgi:hypothetical protein
LIAEVSTQYLDRSVGQYQGIELDLEGIPSAAALARRTCDGVTVTSGLVSMDLEQFD